MSEVKSPSDAADWGCAFMIALAILCFTAYQIVVWLYPMGVKQ